MNGAKLFCDLKEKYLRLQIQRWTKKKVKMHAKDLTILLNEVANVGVPENEEDEETLRHAIVCCEAIIQGFDKQLDQAKSLLSGKYSLVSHRPLDTKSDKRQK